MNAFEFPNIAFELKSNDKWFGAEYHFEPIDDGRVTILRKDIAAWHETEYKGITNIVLVSGGIVYVRMSYDDVTDIFKEFL